jgi:uncharacterized protein (DUF885 family)
MPEITPHAAQRPVRAAADTYVKALVELNPFLATRLGIRQGQDRMPDLSPAGQEAEDDLSRSTLAALDALGAAAPDAAGDERRCARLLRERLESGLVMSDAGEHLRQVSNIFGPLQSVRSTFMLMPAETADDWAVIARRMHCIPAALAGYRESLAEGMRCGLFAAPLQVRTVAGQLEQWLSAAGGRGWFAEFAAPGRARSERAQSERAQSERAQSERAQSERAQSGQVQSGQASGAQAQSGEAQSGQAQSEVPAAVRRELDTAATAAAAAVSGLRGWLSTEYLAGAQGTPDGVGAERYLRSARQWTGATLDLAEVYAWGWSQFTELRREMQAEAQQVLPGAAPIEAMRFLDEHSAAVDGVEQVRLRLQQMMNDAIADLDGTHFDLAEPLKTVEARIAPAGSAAAPYYTAPAQDFSRPGRTWLPTLGRTRFPEWSLISVWYHEGVPGHHLQLAQWVYMSQQLSMYQTSVGGVSACLEGWALYAERLMDELGYLRPAGARLGYLDAQLMRAIRVVIDVGMHLGLEVPADSPIGAGQVWTAELAGEFFKAHSGHEAAFIDSEIVRYLGAPGQAISYKLGERAWLAGREAARTARGDSFDLKAWHMAALSLGSLGLDDLSTELGQL